MARISTTQAVAELSCREPVVARLAGLAGPFRLRPRDPDGHFGALVHAIAYQQLAGAAARTIHGRFRALVDGPLLPEAVLALPDASMRGAGLSAAKTASIRDLATKVLDGTVVLDRRISRLADDEIVERLVAVRGIGRWTAEMFLLFELRRFDVWPVDDLAVRAGYGLAWGLDPAPTARQLDSLGEPFRPYRSIVAWYCWQAVRLHRSGMPVGPGEFE